MYIGTLHLRRSSALSRAEPRAKRRAGENRSLVPACNIGVETRRAHHRLDYASIFIRYITRLPRKGPFGNYCANTRTCERRSALVVYSSRSSPTGVDPLYSHSRESASRRAPDERTDEQTNGRMYERTNRRMKKERGGGRRGAAKEHTQTLRLCLSSRNLFILTRARNSSPACSSRRLAGNYQWHPAGNSTNDCRHTNPFDR